MIKKENQSMDIIYTNFELHDDVFHIISAQYLYYRKTPPDFMLAYSDI